MVTLPLHEEVMKYNELQKHVVAFQLNQLSVMKHGQQVIWSVQGGMAEIDSIKTKCRRVDYLCSGVLQAEYGSSL
jgi:hypothetical protein